MSTWISQELRCPRCAASVRAGSDWCTLCYTDLRPPPPVPDQPAPVVSAPVVSAPVASAPVRSAGGKHARRADPDVETDRDAAQPPSDVEVDLMLAELAAAEGGDPLGRYSRHLDTKRKQIAVILGGTAVLTLLIFIVLAVLGALL